MAGASKLHEAQLVTIDFAGLYNGNEEQARKLFDACKHHGFFYLDLAGFESDVCLDGTLESMYTISKNLFNLQEAEKIQYDVDKIGTMKVCGYKPMGRNSGGIAGQRDGFETFAIPKDNLIGLASYPLPSVIDEQLPTVKDFAKAMLTINHTVLSTLSKALQLSPDQSLESSHRAYEPSPDIIRLLQYNAQPESEMGAPHQPHTDIGTTTILFTKEPGLQVLPLGAHEWEYVMPRANHAIVNLGDGMSMLTNGLFHSCLHRVAPMPGQAMRKRHSFVYLLRAEGSTLMTGGDSPLIPARDPVAEVLTSQVWLQKKFQAMRLATHKPQDDWRVTGRREGVMA